MLMGCKMGNKAKALIGSAMVMSLNAWLLEYYDG